jgi:membrane protein YqaA with SNARE-associated domain|tara:strand:+ start:1012 stop:1431 length:420 start_codon:yes stop_codon:yes gene_type:complete
MITHLSLLLISFLAATILPLSSELALGSLLKTKEYNSFILIGTASLGNILGSVFNWLLGFYLFKYINKKWFPFKVNQINAASKRFRKLGVYSLLFAWIPIIGDPLTFIAGILKVNFLLFIVLVTIGKISRYFFVYALVN